jgi:hypothetical protein
LIFRNLLLFLNWNNFSFKSTIYKDILVTVRRDYRARKRRYYFIKSNKFLIFISIMFLIFRIKRSLIIYKSINSTNYSINLALYSISFFLLLDSFYKLFYSSLYKPAITSRHPNRPGRYAEKAPWHKKAKIIIIMLTRNIRWLL